VGKVYKDKKSSGCAMCKPYKHGWAPKKKARTVALEQQMNREIAETIAHADNRSKQNNFSRYSE